MPYENEHACRLLDPGQFDRFRRANCDQKHNGKCIDVIYGIKGDKSAIQSLRFNKKIWTESSARSVCSDRGGRFEPATSEEQLDGYRQKINEILEEGTSL